MSTVKPRDIDRTIQAVAKLGLFCMRELELNERDFDRLWDDVTWLLEQVNDERFRLTQAQPTER